MTYSKLDRKFKRMGLERYGQGIQIDPLPIPQVLKAKQSDFSGGYDARDARQDLPRNHSPYFTDMEVSDRDEIIRAPGVRLLETYATRTPTQGALHADLDGDTVVVLFDDPWLGVFNGVSTAWTNHGIVAPVGHYAYTNFGGTLVFSPGVTAVYSRDPDTGAVATIAGAPPARAYANFVGRIFALHTHVGSAYNPMGIAWSDSTSTATGWTLPTSGNELLISNRMEKDYGVALIPMGFDLMAVVCRRSIWIATRTGQTNRPADFQPRIEGEGAVSGECVVATPFGVCMLSDENVIVFDGNRTSPIGDQIQPDLFPLDFDSLSEYSVKYHSAKKRLYVTTPTATWIYDFRKQRWYRRSWTALDLIPFGTEEESYDLLVLGVDNAGRTVIGIEDDTVSRYFDIDMSSVWEFPLEEGEYVNQIISTTRFLLQHLGDGTLEVWQPNVDGDYESVDSITLTAPAGTKPKLVHLPFLHSGLGLGMQLHVISGRPRITSIAVEYSPGGPRIPELDRAETLVPVYVAAGQYWKFLPYDEVSGLTTGAFDNSAGYTKLGTSYDDMVMRRTVDDYTTLTDI